MTYLIRSYVCYGNFSLMQWRNLGGAFGVITPPSRKNLALLKEYQNDVVIFVFVYFKFCPATEKCYYVFISLKTSEIPLAA